jgi:hypothetical protein
MTLPAMAQYKTGVKGGDWIKYNFKISAMGISYEGTIKVTIQEVTSTYITGTMEYTGNFPGMPSGSTPFSIHIPTWSDGGGFLIPSNLDAGQSIPGVGTTVQAIVDWQGRKAVKATADFSGFPVEAYWDQATGVLLEMKGSISTPSGSTTLNIKAAETNMFSLGFDWLFWIIIIVVVAVVAVVAVIIIRRIRKPPTAPPPTAQPPPPQPPAPES